MKSTLIPAALALALSGCVTTPAVDTSRAVPISDILSILAERPYECGNYRPGSDACEYVATYTPRGAGYVGRADLAFQDNPPVTGFFTLDMSVEGDALCAPASSLKVQVRGADAGTNTVFNRALQQVFSGYQTICGRYYRTGPDTFLAISTDRAGNELPDGRSTVRFFDAPKSLYVSSR